MELKLTASLDVLRAVAVLIVPLWNWNDGTFEMPDGKTSFNRTFMELKSPMVEKSSTATPSFNRTFMELK